MVLGEDFLNTTKKDWFLPVLIVGVFLLGCALYPQMPAEIPSHWNAKGIIDSYSSRFSGVTLLPVLGLIVYIGLKIIPYITSDKWT